MEKIAVVTVTYNAADLLRETIESVLCQDYSSLSYWIVDGGSSDETIKIAEGYKEGFSKKRIQYHIISQKDTGIFDAMNKAVRMLSDDFVLFLNAGDFFATETVVSEVFCQEDVHCFDIIYGDYYAFAKGRRKKYISGLPEELPKRMIGTHQAIFTKVSLLQQRPYDTRYSMTADYDFYLSMYLKGKKFRKVNTVIVYFDIAGISQKKARLTQTERLCLLEKNGCISKNEHEKRKKEIFWICLKKQIIAHLPSCIRYSGYEKVPF